MRNIIMLFLVALLGSCQGGGKPSQTQQAIDRAQHVRDSIAEYNRRWENASKVYQGCIRLELAGGDSARKCFLENYTPREEAEWFLRQLDRQDSIDKAQK